MKAVFLIRPGLPHHALAAAGVTEGLARHGIEVITCSSKDCAFELGGADFAICWGWRIGRTLSGMLPTMVLERGYFGDRMSWTSIGWNGLNGRARFPKWCLISDTATRFNRLKAEHLYPWIPSPGNAAVIMGQVRGDAALATCPDYLEWLDEAARELSKTCRVKFRPHPADMGIPTPSCAERLGGSLHDALAIASHVVTWNSNAAVDAMLAGVECNVMDRGSMAWPVAGQGVLTRRIRPQPDRLAWFADLTMAQWTPAEIAGGDFWPWHAPILNDLKQEAAPAHV